MCFWDFKTIYSKKQILILKTNTMSMFKKAKAVMLPTNEPSKIGNLATYQGRSLAKVIKEGVKPINTIVQFWNLYIISDDEIKEGDWYINLLQDNTIYQNNIKNYNVNKSYFKKIIATTDTSLKIPRKNSHPNSVWKLDGALLPQPSKQFIEKYIEEYNKGNVITEILVEYELISNEEYFGNTVNPDNDVPYFDEKLKINPKDNTITIKKIKDSYSREEVIELLKDIASDANRDSDFSFNTNKWIEENL